LIPPPLKIRDYIKHPATLARVAVSYSLLERLVAQAARAGEVKASLNGQAEVFKAWVWGLFREQGVSPVDLWHRSVLQVYVQDAYAKIRREYLLPVQPPPVPQIHEPMSKLSPSPETDNLAGSDRCMTPESSQ